MVLKKKKKRLCKIVNFQEPLIKNGQEELNKSLAIKFQPFIISRMLLSNVPNYF